MSIPSAIHTKYNRFFRFLTIMVLGVLIDQLTKSWALHSLYDRDIYIGSTQIGFSLTSNSGSAFSLFRNSTLLVTVVACLLTGILIIAAILSTDSFTQYCYVVIATGALGNIIDRFFRSPGRGYGHVVDFISFGSFPTFNIADSLVSLGVLSLLIYSFLKKDKSSIGNQHGK